MILFSKENLLWVYIKTRATIDLDFATLKNNSNESVKSNFNKKPVLVQMKFNLA